MTEHTPASPSVPDLTEGEFIALLDHALDNGQAVVDTRHNLIILPDVLYIQGIANGLEAPPTTWAVERADGRIAYLFGYDRNRHVES